ncbi:HCL133Wp [Eremothecium sinecaudum]|uniref:trimethyllysine dioxygenase n=1 Tax=Eremothecium sinecaudum TaxID=45286 RepID=A0A0X8HRD3_9SACH|nr:HCL133Wp [Eremothecium sinecaudum]AMD20018.1 HCL133Wp [Eremothecium sinecaudum]
MRIVNIDSRPLIFESYVILEFEQSVTSTFHWIYLRDNCTCSCCLYPDTAQRCLDTFNELPWDIDPYDDRTSETAKSLAEFKITDDGDLEIKWPDSHMSVFSPEWLVNHSYDPPVPAKAVALALPDKVHWDKALFDELTGSGDHFNTDFNDLEHSLTDVLLEIYRYGFTFIKNVPVSIEATEHVSKLISIIRPSHYDTGVWQFTSDLAKKDTAYTTLSIDMHTDGNYWYELPGLQLFHLLEHSNGEGGHTRIVDVAKVVDKLRDLAATDKSWETTYKVLTQHKLGFHQSGETNCIFYQEAYPTLTLSQNGELQQCRWNTSDRAPQIVSRDFTVPQIYEALFRFNSLINDPKNSVTFQLSPGTILVFDNWRVLHARTAFTGRRRLCGSYLTRDDFIARLRALLFKRDQILNVSYA